MAQLFIFHHALGLTDGVRDFARRLADAGHQVSTPDLFDGRLFTSIHDGVEYAERVGFEEIAARGVRSLGAEGAGAIVAGFSLGAFPAQKAAQTLADVAGCVLYHSVVPPQAFGRSWPSGLPLQLHLSPDDPWAEEDIGVARELAEAAEVELFEYDGAGHLIADSGHADFDPVQAAMIKNRTSEFLARYG